MTHNPRRLPVTLNGVSYQTDPERLERRFLPFQRQPIDTGREPGEQSLNPLGPWRKIVTDWSLGAGQEFQDLPESSPREFFDSEGIDPWTKGTLRLLPELQDKAGFTNVSSVRNQVIQAGGYLYMSNGTQLLFTADPTLATPVWSDANIQAGEVAVTVRSIVTDGTYVYAHLGANGIHRTTIGATTSSHWSGATNHEHIFVVKGRLVSLDQANIYEVDSAGTATSLFAHDAGSGGWDFHDVTEAPSGIYVCGESKSQERGEVYFVGIKNDASLATPILATELPKGEGCRAVVHYGGVLVLGTTRGVRLAQIQGDGSVVFGPLVELDEQVEVGGLYPDGEFVYVGAKESSSNELAVYRLKLSEFTAPLAPAYASEMAEALGGATKNAQAIAKFGGRFYVRTDDGLVGQTANRQATGHVRSGWIRWGVNERKVLRTIEVNHEPLPAGASVAVEVEREYGTSYSFGSSSTTAATSKVLTNTAIPAGSAFRIKVTVNRATDTTVGPVITQVSAYAHPVPGRTEEFILPLFGFEALLEESGRSVYQDADTVLAALRSLVKSRTVVTLGLGGESYEVTVENVEQRPEEGRDWNDNRTALEGLVYVTCQTADLQVV